MNDTTLLLLVYLFYGLVVSYTAATRVNDVIEDDFIVYTTSPVEARAKRDESIDDHEEEEEEGSGSFPVLYDQTSPPRYYNMNQRDDLIASSPNSEYVYRQYTTAASRAPTGLFKKLLQGPRDQSILPIWNGVNGNHIVFTDSPITIFGSYFNSFGGIYFIIVSRALFGDI